MKKHPRSPASVLSPDIRERVRLFAQRWTRIVFNNGNVSENVAFRLVKGSIYAGFLAHFWQGQFVTNDVIQNAIAELSLIPETGYDYALDLEQWAEAFPDLNRAEALGYLFEFLHCLKFIAGKDHKLELRQDLQGNARAGTGFVFTPYGICEMMVDNALTSWIQGIGEDFELPMILDPACGGGAFLIAAARVLGHRFPHILLEDIIQNNLYGVDVDPEATLVTQCSLWCLAGNPALPPNAFAGNIAAGNAILPPSTPPSFKPLIWEQQFPNIAEHGGFDIVIGNPPYVRQEKIREFKPFLQKFKSYSATADLYIYFFEQGFNLLRSGGILSLITSNSFLRTRSARPLRAFLSTHTRIVDFRDAFEGPIFEASVTPCILTVQKAPPSGEVRVNDSGSTPHEYLGGDAWSFVPRAYLALLAKLKTQGRSLGEFCNVYFCIKPGRVRDLVLSPKKITELDLEETWFQPVLRGTDIRPYAQPVPKMKLWFPYLEQTFTRIEFATIEVQAPRIAAYLRNRRGILEARDDYCRNRERMAWYELRPCSYYPAFRQPKVVTPDICSHNSFTVDLGGHLCLDTVFMLRPKTEDLVLNFLVGYLNSHLVEFFLKMTCSSLGPRGFRYKKQFLEQIPLICDQPLMHAVGGLARENLQQEKPTLQAEIDTLVAEAFQLTAVEIKTLDQFFTSSK